MEFPPDLGQDFLTRARAAGLRSEDVTEHFILGTGKGGQNRNKRATAVQLVHHPTGVVIRAQRKREQHQNRLDAWHELIEKLEKRKENEERARQKIMRTIRVSKRKRSKKAKEKILGEKRKRSEIKRGRRVSRTQSIGE